MSSPTETEEGSSVDEDASTESLFPVEAKTLHLLFYLGLLVWLVYLTITAWGWSWEDKLIPILVIIPTTIFLLIKMMNTAYPDTWESLKPDFGGEDEDSGGRADKLAEEYRNVAESDLAHSAVKRDKLALTMIGWSIVLPLMINFLGFGNAIPLFLFLFGLHFYDSPRNAAVLAIVFTIALYIFFVQILGTLPYAGTLELPSPLDLLELF